MDIDEDEIIRMLLGVRGEEREARGWTPREHPLWGAIEEARHPDVFIYHLRRGRMNPGSQEAARESGGMGGM